MGYSASTTLSYIRATTTGYCMQSLFFLSVSPRGHKSVPCPFEVCSEPNANPLRRALLPCSPTTHTTVNTVEKGSGRRHHMHNTTARGTSSLSEHLNLVEADLIYNVDGHDNGGRLGWRRINLRCQAWQPGGTDATRPEAATMLARSRSLPWEGHCPVRPHPPLAKASSRACTMATKTSGAPLPFSNPLEPSRRCFDTSYNFFLYYEA
jgi:hypothetical protein